AMSQCPAPDACHFVGVCDPPSGTCKYADKPDGMGCTDDNACTVDSCQKGSCVSESVLDGTPCNEGDLVGQCIAGKCLVDASFTGGTTGATGATGTGGGTGASGGGGSSTNPNGGNGASGGGGSANAGGGKTAGTFSV